MAINDKILKIMSLALEISPPTEERVFGDGKPDVFVYYLAHCSTLEVKICSSGWHTNGICDYESEVYLNWEDNIDERLNEIVGVLERLKGADKNPSKRENSF